MTPRFRFSLLLATLLALGGAVFLTGITWGLPSRSADALLFGRLAPWDGERILRLAGQRSDDATRGADVDVDPLRRRDAPVCLNQTDEQRAEILRRFRLYSNQPDEMITLMALASMHPGEGRLDPKLYQYGGLWIYGVGALLRLAALSGNITLISDLTYYLDFPEEFGKFYVVARLYSAVSALVGLLAMLWVARRLSSQRKDSTGELILLAAAGMCYVFMPIVVDMSHEAKPHLPGAVLMLLAVIAAIRHVDTGRTGWWLAASGLCGMASGMVLSALPVFVVLPVMVLLRRESWRDALQKVALGGLVGVAVYLLTNPYVLINAFVNRAVLRSNFGNSIAMYEISRLGDGVCNALSLVATGTSPLLAAMGFLAAIGWLFVRRRTGDPANAASSKAVGWLLATPALAIAAQFVALAAGKPGEYGRFAVFIDIALMLAAVVGVARLLRGSVGRLPVLALLVAATAWPGLRNLRAFGRDCAAATTRIQTARELAKAHARGARTLGIFAEPAPYNFPPVDLFHWQIMLLPAHPTPAMLESIDVLLRVEDAAGIDAGLEGAGAGSTLEAQQRWWRRSISWADRRFELRMYQRAHAATQAASLPSGEDDHGPAMEDDGPPSELWDIPVEPVPRR